MYKKIHPTPYPIPHGTQTRPGSRPTGNIELLQFVPEVILEQKKRWFLPDPFTELTKISLAFFNLHSSVSREDEEKRNCVK